MTDMKQKYSTFIITSMLYAIFSVFFLYKNTAGITYPLFILITIMYYVICFCKLDVVIKKSSIFYLISMELFGVSICCTSDMRIIITNKVAIFVLFICFMMHQVYNDKNLDVPKYVSNFFITIINIVVNITKPVTDGIDCIVAKRKEKEPKEENKTKKKSGKGLYIFLGLAIAIPLAIITLGLLSSADKVFAETLRDIFDLGFIIDNYFDINNVIILIVVFVFISYMSVASVTKKTVDEIEFKKPRLEPLVAITITIVLSVIYFLFCMVQIRYLFAGENVLPSGDTYAEYARTGFFQLIFVSILNVVLVVLAIHLFKPNALLKGMLVFISVCTYIMIASSAYRMILYIQYKYLTFDRIAVLVVLLMISLIMVGVIISIFKETFSLMKYSVVVCSIIYLIFSFTRPDYWIAKVNIDNMRESTQYEFFENTPVYDDYEYITELSLDAACVILEDADRDGYEDFLYEYEDEYEEGDYRRYNYHYFMKEYDLGNVYMYIYMDKVIYETEDMGIRDFNISKYQAKDMVD